MEQFCVHLYPGSQLEFWFNMSHYHIRALRHIRPILDANTARLVGHALVSSRLDYANSIMYGMSKSLTDKLQRQQNMLARVVLRTNRLSSAGPLLNELHWLPVASRIQFKIATLTHKILNTGTPSLSVLSAEPLQTNSTASFVQLKSPGTTTFQNQIRLSGVSHRCTTDLEWPASRCQVISFVSDLQENAQNSLFPQPSHLGHVVVPRLRFVSTGPLGPCHYDLGVCFKLSLLLLFKTRSSWNQRWLTEREGVKLPNPRQHHALFVSNLEQISRMNVIQQIQVFAPAEMILQKSIHCWTRRRPRWEGQHSWRSSIASCQRSPSGNWNCRDCCMWWSWRWSTEWCWRLSCGAWLFWVKRRCLVMVCGSGWKIRCVPGGNKRRLACTRKLWWGCRRGRM